MPVSVVFWKIEFGADLIMKFMRIFLQANDCTWLLNRCVYLFFFVRAFIYINHVSHEKISENYTWS